MTISKAFLDELRQRLTLSEIISRRVKLTRAGREYKGCCPFHNEKTPSFYVNDQKAFYHCFGCGAHGDVISFLIQHDNLSFPEAVEQLAGQAGLEVPKPTPEERERFEKQKTLYDVVESATKWFEKQLYTPEGREGLEYLQQRGLDDDTITRFRLGFAPNDSKALQKAMEQQGHGVDQMIEAGLIREGRNNDHYSFFRGRVLFPVADRRGRVVAFGGRVLPSAEDAVLPGERKPPKYINSADNPLFHKGKMLYSMSRARKAAGDGHTLIVVEGYMDVIACVRAGFNGAVAPLGTALTEEQITELWRMAPPENRFPVLCFDGDNAGRRAAYRALDRALPLLKPDHSLRFAFLPEGEDPDTLIAKNGKSAFKAVLEKSRPMVDILWEREVAGRQLLAPEERAGLKSSLEEQVRQIDDRTVQQFYLQEIRSRIDDKFGGFGGNYGGGNYGAGQGRDGGSRKWGGREWGRNNKSGKWNKGANNGPSRPMRPVAPNAGAATREQVLLATMINHPALFDEVEEDFGMLVMSDSQYEALRQDVLLYLSENPGLDAEALRSHLTDKGYARTLAVLMDEGLYFHAGWARPDKPMDEVRQGWRDVWQRHQRANRHVG